MNIKKMTKNLDRDFVGSEGSVNGDSGKYTGVKPSLVGHYGWKQNAKMYGVIVGGVLASLLSYGCQTVQIDKDANLGTFVGVLADAAAINGKRLSPRERANLAAGSRLGYHLSEIENSTNNTQSNNRQDNVPEHVIMLENGNLVPEKGYWWVSDNPAKEGNYNVTKILKETWEKPVAKNTWVAKD